jgi:hypothetical protein
MRSAQTRPAHYFSASCAEGFKLWEMRWREMHFGCLSNRILLQASSVFYVLVSGPQLRIRCTRSDQILLSGMVNGFPLGEDQDDQVWA